MKPLIVPALVAMCLAACDSAPRTSAVPALSSEWHEFSGTWNALGSRHAISLGSGRTSAVIELHGTMLLAGKDRPGVGFRADTIALADSTSGLIGRSVWTDEHGEQVYSELKGEGTADRNRISGTIVGGTGRYANATGTYEFSWQSVIEADEGAMQGRAVDLKGRVRVPSTTAGTPK